MQACKHLYTEIGGQSVKHFFNRYINILFDSICFGVLFTIFMILKEKLKFNIGDKELIIWALVLYVVASIIIRTIMDKINNKKVDNREHTNIN